MLERLNTSTLFVATIVALSCIGQADADNALQVANVAPPFIGELVADDSAGRHLKSSTTLTKVEEEALGAEDEERAGWQSAATKLKAVNRFKSAGVNGGVTTRLKEAEVKKITEQVAQEVAKKPSKWRVIKKILKITYGVALATLIIVGVEAMLSSA
ncbi:hypothetical protein PHYPSEUDO_008214 [Phytophthora pseudosyringae]|uniref:RxLR effector protein n=1 Tax=Phytophthora pseudosyringae TaxID=221518 RepID=A0A8T1VFP8_9STRA|nr:hypothetical protein PHYPSEUDO_008214 [Phytophthora pseudosyringae]